MIEASSLMVAGEKQKPICQTPANPVGLLAALSQLVKALKMVVVDQNYRPVG